MEYSFHVQDPSDPDTLYLYEALVGQVKTSSLRSWRGIFAFATGNAVHSLFVEDPDVNRFVRTGKVSLVVGIDAVTNVSALEQLAELNRQYTGFHAKVFVNPGTGLFHPKISHFSHDGGGATLIVGSGNLTPGGLKNNIEAFSVVVAYETELASLSAWDEFLLRHSSDIRDIDEEALSVARANQAAWSSRRQKAKEAEPDEVDGPEESENIEDDPEPLEESRILVARVPRGAGRWQQIHYNERVVSQFFRIAPGTEHRVFLRQIHTDGTTGPIEPRPLVYSETNRNMKIEAAAGRNKEYPDEGRPIIVLRETGARSFDYILLMPEDAGHKQMMDFTEQRESVGRTVGDVRRVIATYGELKREWPDFPL